MTEGFPNPYLEERDESPGEAEIKKASWLLMGFRALKVPMPLKTDEEAVHRTGVLLSRWWRNLWRAKE